MPPRFLGLAEVVEIHEDQVARHGGLHGIRDLGLLSSAVAMPQAGVFGQYVHADLFEIAAAYLYHIVRNHPFLDGNKRTGAAASLVFLALNGITIEVSDDALVELTISVAVGSSPKSTIADFFRSHQKGAEG